PLRFPDLRRYFFKLRLLGDQRLEFVVGLRERLVVEAAAGSSHINEVAISVQPEQQRTEILARTFRLRKSADHEVIRLLSFYLQPIARPRLLVLTALQFRDDSFQAMLRDDIEELHA